MHYFILKTHSFSHADKKRNELSNGDWKKINIILTRNKFLNML